ncbi:MAG: MFS transporter [Nakamurella sp.]
MTDHTGSSNERTARGSHAVRRGRVSISAAFFAQGFVFAVVLTHLGAFGDAWNLDDLGLTIIMFSVAVFAAVGSVVAGLLSARWGSAAALRAGLVGIAAAVGVAAVAPNFAVFCVGLAIYGGALGCVDATTNMQAVACEALQGRSILTSFHAAWSAGGILGALETSGTASWQWSLGASLLVALIPPLLASGMPLLGMTTTTEPAVASPAMPGELAALSGNPHPAPVIPWKTVSILGAAIVLFYIADSATQSWSTIYLHDVLTASAAVAPLGYAAYQASSLVSRGFGDLLVRRFGPVAVVRMSAGVGTVGLVMVVFAPALAWAIVGFGVLGLGIAVVAPLTFAAAGRLADAQPGAATDPRIRRRAADAIVARINQFNYLGFVLGGVLTGLVASGSSMREGFIVPLVGIVLILPLAHVFVRRAPAQDETAHAHQNAGHHHLRDDER